MKSILNSQKLRLGLPPLLLLAFFTLALAACGNKNALYYPDSLPEAQAPSPPQVNPPQVNPPQVTPPQIQKKENDNDNL
ncbi:MAG: hypothetical protein KUG82_17260 [Pseudomonadales bacterium]|nr:hypothetical protein [Pseudomonadales bacterium]